MTRSAHSTHRTAPAWRTPAIAAGVVALAVLAGLLFAFLLGRDPGPTAADPSPSATPMPSASAPPSATPSPSAAPIEQPAASDAPSAPAEPSAVPDDGSVGQVVLDPEGMLPPGAVVRVTADSVRVREQAILESAEVTTVQRGQLLIVGPTASYQAFGPAEEGGYTWYPVGVLDLEELPAPGGAPLAFEQRGWAALGDGESQWLEMVPARCTDDEPTLQHLTSLTEWERLACYGNTQLTFEGIMGCGGCGGLIPGTFTPEWLATPMNYDFISVEPQDRIGPMTLHWSPDGPERPDTAGVAPILRVTGHFDDPAAADCSITFVTDTFDVHAEETLDPAISQLYCRSKFVVESYETLGEDEDFPFG